MIDFHAEEAFAANLRKDGHVVVDDLCDPDTNTVIVAQFVAQDNDYTAIYHDNINKWEIFGPAESYLVVGMLHPLARLAYQTVEQFRDVLLDGPSAAFFTRQLTRLMAIDIQTEMDNEILRDLGVISPVITPTKHQNVPRKLKATWSSEARHDLRAMTVNTIIAKSRLDPLTTG